MFTVNTFFPEPYFSQSVLRMLLYSQYFIVLLHLLNFQVYSNIICLVTNVSNYL